MACHSFESLILARLDGTLSEESRRELESHLEICSSCRKFQASQERLDAMLSENLTAPPLPGGFKERVLRRVEVEERKEERFRFLPHLLDPIGYFILAVVAGSFLQYLFAPLADYHPDPGRPDVLIVFASWLASGVFLLWSLWFAFKKQLRRFATRHHL